MGFASLIGPLLTLAISVPRVLSGEVCYHEHNIGCFQDNAPGNALPQSPEHQQVMFESYRQKYATRKLMQTEIHAQNINAVINTCS